MHISPATRPIPQLGPEFYESSDAYGVTRVGWLVAVLCTELAMAPLAVETGVWWLVAVVFVLLGASAYKLTIVMHECSHKTLFRTPALNRWVGLAAGALLVSKFGHYARQHWSHHRHCGTNEDGESSDYLLLTGATRGQLLRHLLRPLSGATVLEILRPHDPVDVTVPVRRDWPHLARVVIAHTLVALVATAGGRHLWLALLFPAAGATFGLFFSRTRAFCEHVSLTRGDGECFARSHEPNLVDRTFFYTLNMNLHVEHHWYPQVPACNLPRLRAFLKQGGHLSAEMTSTSIARTLIGCFAAAPQRPVRPAEAVRS